MPRRQVKEIKRDRLTLAVYSSDREVRAQVKLALSDLLANDLPPVKVNEFATPPALIKALEAGGIDGIVLDGESTPLGGMGLAHQLRDEIPDLPPVVILVARQVDAWLATWSRADAVAQLPVDPLTLPALVADVIRAARAGTLTSRMTVPGAASRH